MKKLASCLLCCALGLGGPAPAWSGYGDENPFVEAMLRMMEVFGLINRANSALNTPYIPGYVGALAPGMGTLGGYPAMAGMPGMSPMSPMGAWGGMPGGIPGSMPGLGQFPGGGMPNLPGNWYAPGGTTTTAADLDGIWELTNGGVAMIKGRKARLFLTKERFQDFTITYDGRHFSWSPLGGNTTTHYRYQMRDGRMVLRDNEGKTLLMRRRN